VVPLAPVIAWITTLVIAKIQLHTFVIIWELAPFYPHIISILLDIDKIMIFGSWLFLLLFAFTKWPLSTRRAPETRSATKAHVTRPVQGDASAPSEATPHSALRYPLSKGPGFGILGFVTGPGTVATQETGGPGAHPRTNQLATFCARCGESVPGNRMLAHNCPNEGQPSLFCRYHGAALSEGSSNCPSCVAPS
jgi:hypothetical protein